MIIDPDILDFFGSKENLLYVLNRFDYLGGIDLKNITQIRLSLLSEKMIRININYGLTSKRFVTQYREKIEGVLKSKLREDKIKSLLD